MQLSDPTYPLFPIFAFLGFILPLIPLPWHLKAYNSGTCYYMIWASIACLNQFVNSIVWADNVTDWAPIWCDISIRIMMGASVGLPAASLCINRRLYHIATSQAVVVTQKEKRRAVLIDTFICVLFPLVFIAMQYIVQGHRFNIFEGIGCYPALYNTPLMYVISAMWPIIIGLISAVYCALTLRAFYRRRVEFSKFLSSNRSLSVSRYFRLMALAMTEICFTMPLAIFMIWLNTTATPIGPWRSWADTHYAFSRVERYPALLWRQSRLLVIAYEFTRWVNPLCALVFFAYFGFADEARKNYRAVWWKGLGFFGIKPKPVERKVRLVESVGKFRKSKTSTVDSLPLYSPSAPSYPFSGADGKAEKKLSISASSYSMSVPDSPCSTRVGEEIIAKTHFIRDDESELHDSTGPLNDDRSVLPDDHTTFHHDATPSHLDDDASSRFDDNASTYTNGIRTSMGDVSEVPHRDSHVPIAFPSRIYDPIVR